jgi:hypothetical protein
MPMQWRDVPRFHRAVCGYFTPAAPPCCASTDVACRSRTRPEGHPGCSSGAVGRPGHGINASCSHETHRLLLIPIETDGQLALHQLYETLGKLSVSATVGNLIARRLKPPPWLPEGLLPRLYWLHGRVFGQDVAPSKMRSPVECFLEQVANGSGSLRDRNDGRLTRRMRPQGPWECVQSCPPILRCGRLQRT